jgi:hypothetical protein
MSRRTPDDLEARLRGALTREADAVDPSADGLRAIRARVAAGEGAAGHRWRGPLVAAVAASAVVLAGVAVAGNRDDGTPRPAPAPATAPPSRGPSPAPTDPPATPTDRPGESATTVDAGTLDTVPVYAIRMVGTEARLVREFRRVPARGDRVTSAVSALALAPVDPDYTTFWRRPSQLSVEVTASEITVDVSADAFADTNLGSADVPAAAVQQLVWTATAAAGRDVPVTVLVDGEAGYEAWGAVALGEPMRRDTAHRAPVWIDSPTDRGRLPAGTQRVTGQGAGFEATFLYTVSNGVREVAQGYVTGTPEGGSYGWWTFDLPLRLPRGTYTVTVTADTGASGSEAGPPWPDTKRFTVR